MLIYLFDSLSNIIRNDEIFLPEQLFQLIDARDVHQFILELIADHRAEEKPDHFDEVGRVDDVKLLQVLLKIPVEFFVRVP